MRNGFFVQEPGQTDFYGGSQASATKATGLACWLKKQTVK
jgi:hypothetical protein